MPDRAHVGLVDAHAEGVRGDDDVGLAAHERVLRRGALVGGHAGVVGGGVQAFGREHRRGLLGRLARAAVDDRGPVLLELEAGDQRRALAGDAALAVEREDVEGEVRAVEAGAHPLGLPETEPRDDLLRDLRRGGRGAGHRRRVAEVADDVGEPQVVGPEVVAPLGHAVRLVDHEQGELAVAGSRAGTRCWRSARGRRRRPSPGRCGSGRARLRCPRRTRASRRGGRGRSGARTGRASARSAARRRPSGPRWRARAAGSRGSCRRRSA